MFKIYFYIPNLKLLEQFEQKNEERYIHNLSTYWLLPTYKYLKKRGFPCELTTKIPKKGILIADRDSLNENSQDFGEVMLICTKADRDFHPSAYLHVVQNQLEFEEYRNSMWHPYYIPHWPEPNLKARNKNRNNLVKNIAYLGTKSQLAPEFQTQEWSQSLEKLGYNWMPIFAPERWHDYSNIDIVIAARDLQGDNSYRYKPASKLINAWRAGVPALLTGESAYLQVKRSELDFWRFDSLETALVGLEELKNNPELYQAMVNNGKTRAKEFSEEIIGERWINFFEKFVFVHYANWLATRFLERKIYYFKRYVSFKTYALQKKFGPATLAKSS
jgi:hypothetical protein